MNNLQESIKKYIRLDREYKDYIIQFVGTGWEGEKFNAPKKVLTRDEAKKIKEMRRTVDKAHKDFLNVLVKK